jgi:4a-hydroxytetrahydrobiopterin dehydratase
MRNDDELLSASDLQAALSELANWEASGGWLVRRWQTNGWQNGTLIVGALSFLAEAADHHPDVELTWGSVVVRLQTHTAGGITGKDIALARQIEALVSLKF